MASLTYSNIETRCANALRIPTSNTTEMTKLAAVINEVYRDIGARYPNWWWRRKRQIVNTSDDISTGTVAVTAASTTITFSSAPASSVAGWVLLVPGDTQDSGAVWRISAHTAASATATLDAAYTGATNTAASYNLYKDRYALASDTGVIVNIKRYGFINPMRLIGPDEMDALKIYDTSTSKPEVACVRDFSTSGDPTTAPMLEIHPYPDNTYRIEIDYSQSLNTELSSTTRPLVPDDYSQVLIYGTLARAYPIFLNDTERGMYFQNLFNDILALMVAEQRHRVEGLPSVSPKDSYRSFYQRGKRATAANADLGSQFGRWPYQP